MARKSDLINDGDVKYITKDKKREQKDNSSFIKTIANPLSLRVSHSHSKTKRGHLFIDSKGKTSSVNESASDDSASKNTVVIEGYVDAVMILNAQNPFVYAKEFSYIDHSHSCKITCFMDRCIRGFEKRDRTTFEWNKVFTEFFCNIKKMEKFPVDIRFLKPKYNIVMRLSFGVDYLELGIVFSTPFGLMEDEEGDDNYRSQQRRSNDSKNPYEKVVLRIEKYVFIDLDDVYKRDS